METAPDALALLTGRVCIDISACDARRGELLLQPLRVRPVDRKAQRRAIVGALEPRRDHIGSERRLFAALARSPS